MFPVVADDDKHSALRSRPFTHTKMQLPTRTAQSGRQARGRKNVKALPQVVTLPPVFWLAAQRELDVLTSVFMSLLSAGGSEPCETAAATLKVRPDSRAVCTDSPYVPQCLAIAM